MRRLSLSVLGFYCCRGLWITDEGYKVPENIY